MEESRKLKAVVDVFCILNCGMILTDEMQSLFPYDGVRERLSHKLFIIKSFGNPVEEFVVRIELGVE